MSAANERSEGSARAALLWGAAAALACAAMAPLEPNLLEEGILVHAAQRILGGERLYTDILVFTGPLPFELLGWLFRLFGEELAVARGAVALLHGLAAAAACALARRSGAAVGVHVVGAAMTSAPALLFPLLSTYYYSTIQLSIFWLAAYATVRGLTQARWALAAGALVAAAALCKQQAGPFLGAGLPLAAWLCAPREHRWRASLWLIAGGATTALLTLGTYAVDGRLDDVVHALVVLPLSFEGTYQAPFVNLWPLGEFDERIPPSQIAFYLPYFYALLYGQWGGQPGGFVVFSTQVLFALPFVAGVVTLMARARGPLSSGIWINGVVLVALLTTLFPRTDWGHLVFVLPTTVVQFVMLAANGRAASPGRVAAAAAMGCFLLPAVAVGGWLYTISGEPSFGPRVRLRTVSEGFRTDAVPRAIRYVREHTEPGEEIFVPRAEPLLYFATETRNATPYPGVIPGIREEQQRVIVEALERIRFVVMTDIDQPVYTYYRDELPAVQAHLERHFRIPDDYLAEGPNWMMVLERGVDRGATAVDLTEAWGRGEGRAWLRNGAAWSQAPLFGDPLAVVQNRRFLPMNLGSHGGGIDFDIEVPESAVFQASVGYPEATGLERVYPHPVRGFLVVSVGQGGSFETVSTTPVRLERPLDRRWTAIEADLSAYTGRRIVLRLQFMPEGPLGTRRVAWWGSPRLALAPGDDGASGSTPFLGD